MKIAEMVIRIDLHQRGERFRLAVAEAMIVIGRLRRDAHAEQHHQAGDQVEAAVGKRAEHRRRLGLDRRPTTSATIRMTAMAMLAIAARVGQLRALGLAYRAVAHG